MSLGLEDRFVLLYMGNAGFGHRFETIIEATERLRDEPMSLLFVGGGERWNWLRRAKEERGLQNLHLHRYVPEPEARSMLAMADCALVTLRDSYLGVISPSKIHASLAMGLPLIYVGPEGGKCGRGHPALQVWCESAKWRCGRPGRIHPPDDGGARSPKRTEDPGPTGIRGGLLRRHGAA